MARVFKYPLYHHLIQRLNCRLLQPLSVELIDDEPYLWCLVDDRIEAKYFEIVTVGTGHDFEHFPTDTYINTVIARDKTVWHFFLRS